MVSVIILNYRTSDLTIQCISSLKKYHQELKLEIIVVDNNSGDASCDQIQAEHPEAIIIKSASNVGYARGNNLGIKACSGKQILILNPDVIFFEEVINKCLVFAKDSDSYVIGCQLLNEDKSHQKSVYYSIASFRDIWINNYLINRLLKLDEKAGNNEIKAMMGSFLLFPAQILDKTGLFDEHFFMYAEEFEWFHRVQKNNIPLLYCQSASIIHLAGASSNEDVMNFQKYVSQLLLVKKVRGNLYILTFQLATLISLIIQFPFYFLYNQNGRDNLIKQLVHLFRSIPLVYKIIMLGKSQDALIKVV